MAAAAILLIAHKPWALTTPQLWAEDGSIHLSQNDALGARAFFVPYRGYLHLLPRLIAWIASRTADVAYWPAIYNSAALLVAVALFARMASPRLKLPGKPWLVLAFVLAANTGEVFLNITNLQWLTAFFLLQQVLIARPTTPAQRLGDIALVFVTGLTGPFVLVFLPLYVWRWWRERESDSLTVLFAAAGCAAVQGYFIATTGPHFQWQSQPIHLRMLLAVAGSRLVVWPLLGPRVASTLPLPALGAIGVAFVALLALWTLRPDPRRLLRAQILGAFVLIAALCLYRIRPDTWAYPDLQNGDSYFYIPRTLLAWLLIWEFDAAQRSVAWIARALCIAGVLVNLPSYIEPAPPDYHWAELCDYIRRGAPADIPTLPEGYTFGYSGRPPLRDSTRPEEIRPEAPVFCSFPRLLCSTKANFTYRLKIAYGPPARFRATGLPAGLELDGSSGTISGRPIHSGTVVARIAATNPFGTTAGDFAFHTEDLIFFALVHAPAACVAGARVEVRYEAFDAASKLDFIELSDLMTRKTLDRLSPGIEERQSWQGTYSTSFLQPGAHNLVLRFVRFDSRQKSPYTFIDRSVEIRVASEPMTDRLR